VEYFSIPLFGKRKKTLYLCIVFFMVLDLRLTGIVVVATTTLFFFKEDPKSALHLTTSQHLQ